MRLLVDTRTGYGWTSIALHWLVAIVVVTMLFIGMSISTESGMRALRLHTSLGATFYIIIWFRILWRFRFGHPRTPGQKRSVFVALAWLTHWALILGMGLMLLTGPLLAWSGGNPISFYGWFEIPPPVAFPPGWYPLFKFVHGWSAASLAIGITLHIAGVLKHVVFDRDQLLDRMMVPEAPSPDER